jgi:hypothetical protein
MQPLLRVFPRLLAIVLLLIVHLVMVGCSSNSDDTAADLPPITNVAFVVTTDFDTGSYSVVDVASRRAFNDINRGGIHSDAIARLFNGRVYVVNRFGADNIQIIDPQQGYSTPLGAQLSVGNGLNPQDIAFVDTEKAYVSRLGSTALLIINPTTLTTIGELDLRSLTKPEDQDGLPEVASMLMHRGVLYVVLQHIDFTTPFPSAKVARGEVVVIDPATDTVITVLQLNGTNPFSALQFSAALNRILVSSVGELLVNDGGIEAIDPAINTVDAAFVVDEATMGGDITHFQIVSATKGYAIVADANFANALVSFNPTTGERLATLVGPLDVFMPHFAINSRHELYLAIADSTTPGLRIFDTVSDTERTTTPLNVGLLPFFILFIE